MKKTVLLSMLTVLVFAAVAQAETYAIDPTHSSVGFKVKHMMVSNVRGEFTDFEGTYTFDPDRPQDASVDVEIRVTSVDTGNEKRDDHLRSDEFFGVEEHPVMTFKSTKVVAEGDDEYTLYGDLTIRGVTRNVALEVEFNGKVQDPWGNTRTGFEASGEINRKDFGVNFSATLDNGGLVVADDVEIELEIEGILQK